MAAIQVVSSVGRIAGARKVKQENLKLNADIQLRFRKMLALFIPETGVSPPASRETRILNLGCGLCDEAEALMEYFRNANLIGVDINELAVKHARLNHRGRYSKRLQFIQGDAANLTQSSGVPRKVDVVVIRHHHLLAGERIWENIFQEALKRVTSTGIVLITSYEKIEHMMLKDLIKRKLSCDILVDRINPYALQVDDDKKSAWDKYVLILQRKSLR